MRLKRINGLVGLAIIAVAAAGCAPSSDMDQLQNNEFALRGMVANDRQQIASLQEQVSRQGDKIAELEHGGGTGDVSGGSTGLAALQARVSKLEGQTAAAEPSPSASATPAGDTTSSNDADNGAASAAGAAGAEVASVPPAGSPPAAEATAAPAATPVAAAAATWQQVATQELAGSQTDAGAKQYRSGLAAMQAGQYQAALGKFQDLQRRYPKSPLSEAAEYFSGNALYEMGQFEKAILQFNDMTMRFPEGRFASPALLREAQAFMKINDQIDARLTLQKLLGSHPDAPEVPMAKSMMNSLSS